MPPQERCVRSAGLVSQVLQGLRYMTQCGIMHRDLKPANLLIREDCLVKICDFGMARASKFPDACGGLEALTTNVMTWPYRSPEVILGLPYACDTVDSFSVGVILGEMLQSLCHTKAELRGLPLSRLLLFPVDRDDRRPREMWIQEHLRLIFGLIGRPTAEQLEEVGATGVARLGRAGPPPVPASLSCHCPPVIPLSPCPLGTPKPPAQAPQHAVRCGARPLVCALVLPAQCMSGMTTGCLMAHRCVDDPNQRRPSLAK